MPAADRERTLEEVERVYISETLRKTNWVVGGRSGAAAKLGLPRTTLISRMRKLGIFRDGQVEHTVVSPPVGEWKAFAQSASAAG